MKQGGGRLKGQIFERDVAKMIVTAFADRGITGTDCYRTPSSGGHRFAKKADPGDLCTSPKLRKMFPYCVEAKHYKKLQWHLLMRTGAKGLFAEWWAQARKAAGKTLIPVVVFRENGSPAYILYPADQWNWAFKTSPYIKTRINDEAMRVALFADFLEFVAAGKVRRLRR